MSDRAARLRVFQDAAKTCSRCHDEGLLFSEGERKAYPLFQEDQLRDSFRQEGGFQGTHPP